MNSLVVSQDAVFARTRAELVAIDKETGQERWRKQRDGWGYVSYMEGRVYDVSRDTVIALDGDGAEQWSISIKKFHHARLIEHEGWVYVLARNRFACVHADSGEILVETALDDDDMSHYFPVTDGHRIFAGDSKLFGYEVVDNRFEKRWESQMAPQRLYGFMATDNGLLFRAGFSTLVSDATRGRLSIHDVEDGSLRAEQTFETVPRSPAVVDGIVFVSTSTVSSDNIGDDGKLVALSSEGELLWEYTPEASLQPPVVANDTLYTGPFANREAPLIAFDATSGEELWREDPDTLQGSVELAIAGDMLYVADGTRVRALRT
nr:PQQ-binding-like beta-propeller repeat protein [Haladaptatus sp. DYSN1]